MKVIFYLLFFSFLFIAFNTTAQNRNELLKYYEEKLQVITDSAIQNNKLYLDTIFLDMDSGHVVMTKDFGHFKDSILFVYRDSLNRKRKELVKQEAENIKIVFNDYYKKQIDSINSEYSNFVQFLNQQKELNKICTDCEDKNDFNNGLDDYRDLMDSLSDLSQEKISILADTLSSLVEDSLDGCKDSLLNYTQDLVDDQSEENESKGQTMENGKIVFEPANELDLGVVYDSHYSYRGRDNGITQSSIAPSVQYQHKSGFGAFFDLEFLSKASKNPDDYDAGISFMFDISDVFNIQLLYTHYWLRTGSDQPRATLNNNIEGVFSLETKHFNSDLTLDVDFGGGIREVGITWNNGLPFILSKHILNGKLTFEPNLSIIISEQNSILVLRRKLRNFMVPVIKSSSTFGIMDYEIGFPLTLETKHLILKPVFYLVVPVNVLDKSTRTAFGDFSFEITVPFRF